ncbi:hypothetical protein SUNI508_04166 [Seiridium unicorne]|uniref:Uncharacterized protein n=1 Tax=Seiridium unicorne TaxID=138068 RepID=A0ABR2V8M8_9PEZI
MGAYVSVETCKTQYNVQLNCSLPAGGWHEGNHTYDYIGAYTRGNFEADPDIAGIGILGVFLGVTCFALAISIFDVLWQTSKTFGWKKVKLRELKLGHRSVSDILQSLVLACSDQQVFTGAAYALTLRYWRGCSISAYHYNIVANMLLLTCATHLMSVTIVRNYWRYPWLAVLRVLCICGVFIVTGLLMANQNATQDLKFPTAVPPTNETDSLLFLPAACFQSTNSPFAATLINTTSSAAAFFQGTLVESTPGNAIQGWNWYVVILLFYGAAIVAEFIRFCRRGKTRPGWRGRLGARVSRIVKPKSWQRKFVSCVFLLYLILGAGISSVAVVLGARYIYRLRQWVDRSGWMMLENGRNPENDATSFGQLVPIFLSALILFSFAQMISEKVTDHENVKHEGEQMPPQGGTIAFLDPTNYDLLNPEKQGLEYHGHSIATPGDFDLEAAQPWPSNRPVPKPIEYGQFSSHTSTKTRDTDIVASAPLIRHEITSSPISWDMNSSSVIETPRRYGSKSPVRLQQATAQLLTLRVVVYNSDYAYEAGLAAALAFSPELPTYTKGAAHATALTNTSRVPQGKQHERQAVTSPVSPVSPVSGVAILRDELNRRDGWQAGAGQK